jgi:uncharacterized membrane protein YhaH (DUF805 family)
LTAKNPYKVRFSRHEQKATAGRSEEGMGSFYSSTKGRLLFGLRGRIPRTDFWVGLIATVGITALAILLGGNSVRVGGLGPFFAVVTAIGVLSPFCLAAVVVKRLHDLDKSGWYVVAFLVPLLLAALAVMAHLGLREGRVIEEWQGFWTMTFYIAAGLATVLLAYFALKLGLTRGTLGPNRFGPDPLAPAEDPMSPPSMAHDRYLRE